MSDEHNDYSKKEDYMLWMLHQTRHKIAKQKWSVADINKAAQKLKEQLGLIGLKAAEKWA